MKDYRKALCSYGYRGRGCRGNIFTNKEKNDTEKTVLRRILLMRITDEKYLIVKTSKFYCRPIQINNTELQFIAIATFYTEEVRVLMHPEER